MIETTRPAREMSLKPGALRSRYCKLLIHTIGLGFVALWAHTDTTARDRSRSSQNDDLIVTHICWVFLISCDDGSYRMSGFAQNIN